MYIYIYIYIYYIYIHIYRTHACKKTCRPCIYDKLDPKMHCNNSAALGPSLNRQTAATTTHACILQNKHAIYRSCSKLQTCSIMFLPASLGMQLFDRSGRRTSRHCPYPRLSSATAREVNYIPAPVQGSMVIVLALCCMDHSDCFFSDHQIQYHFLGELDCMHMHIYA